MLLDSSDAVASRCALWLVNASGKEELRGWLRVMPALKLQTSEEGSWFVDSVFQLEVVHGGCCIERLPR